MIRCGPRQVYDFSFQVPSLELLAIIPQLIEHPFHFLFLHSELPRKCALHQCYALPNCDFGPRLPKLDQFLLEVPSGREMVGVGLCFRSVFHLKFLSSDGIEECVRGFRPDMTGYRIEV
jgi:hypothetical protein